jgi:hypothetical protein
LLTIHGQVFRHLAVSFGYRQETPMGELVAFGFLKSFSGRRAAEFSDGLQ